MGPFRLFPESQRWFTFADYGLLLECMQFVAARAEKGAPVRVLEFGPGSSTLALIEGGATHIDTLEDSADWEGVWRERLEAKYPGIVHLHRFTVDRGKVKADAQTLAKLNAAKYDLAFIDGPHDTTARGPALQFALERATCVFVTDQYNDETRAVTEKLVRKFRPAREVEFRDVEREIRRMAWIHPKPGPEKD